MNTKPIKSEKDYLEYARLGQKLGIPTFEAFLELEVRNQQGETVLKHKQRSQSWVRNAYNLLFTEMAAVAGYSGHNLHVVDIGGVTRSQTPDGYMAGAHSIGHSKMNPGKCAVITISYGYHASSGDDSFGIMVGSDNTPESFSDYALAAKISNGTGAGQFSHAAMVLPTVSDIGLTKKAEWQRYFNNNSGGNVTVNEVGLVANGTTADDYSAKFMMARDVLLSTITVPDTGQLRVTYTIQVTYPA